ncbi:TolB family protein [Candidatus Leptofilum sp.]|uniref:TolB family protein n=1 Tax=Candidatus Leptofilum sp. TaxID=3241576 RepID=UPI003B5B0880
MMHKTVYTKLLLVLGLATAVLILTACQTNEPATPTPLATIATPTSQPSHTPTPTIAVTETAVPTSSPSQTATLLSTEIPTAMATPFLAVSRPILSSQGQLAFIKNQTLFVETAVNSGAFNTFEGDIGAPHWSPQGNRFLFYICPTEGQVFCDEPIWMILNLRTNDLVNLNEQISDMPHHFLGTTIWAKNGEIIFLRKILEGNIFIIDLASEKFSLILNSLRLPMGVWELPNEKLLIQDNLGTWANELHVYDFNGTKLWSFPNTRSWGIEGGNAGLLGFSEEGQLLIILEPDESLNEFAAFYRFNTITFATERLATYPILPGASANISPDGQSVALSVPIEQGNFEDRALMIVDLNGRSYGQRPNSIIVDWRPCGGPVVEETLDDGQNQLLYWPLDGTAVQIFAELGAVDFEAGKWSRDGRTFIYSAVDEAENQSRLYLWQPEATAPTLLVTAEGTDGFQNFAWLPDSTAVYFNFGRTELWKFEVANQGLSLIASATD